MMTFQFTSDRVLKGCYIDEDGKATCSMVHMGPLLDLIRRQIAETHDDLHDAVDTYETVSGLALIGAKKRIINDARYKKLHAAAKKKQKKKFLANAAKKPSTFTPPPAARSATATFAEDPVSYNDDPSTPPPAATAFPSAPVFDDYGDSEEYDQEMMEDGAYDEVVSGGWFDKVKRAMNPEHLARVIEKHKKEIAGAMNLVAPGTGSGVLGVLAMKDQVERAIRGDKKAKTLLKVLKHEASKGNPDAAKAIEVASTLYQTIQLGA